MASFTERIRLIFDVDSKGATTGFRGFATSVREAEGLTGKMKAGAGSLTATLKDNMGPAALAAGAALVTFGVKAVGAFTDTAKAALDMSKATGLSVEQASRWIAIGDDMGVTAEQLTTGIGKIAKTLDGAQWAKYGIATKDAAGKTRDANDVLLDALDALGKIQSTTERASAGNELFGKGYANLSPLIGKSREELEKYLASVEAGQVITEKEAKKAERMRLAMDQLNDAIGEVTLAFGGLVAGMAPAIERTADMIGYVTELEDKFHLLEKAMQGLDLLTPMGQAEAAWNGAREEGQRFADMTRDELIANVNKYVESTEEATTAVEQWAAKNKPTAESLREIYNALGLAVPATEAMASAIGRQIAEHDTLTAAIERQTQASWGLYSAQLALISGQIDQSAATQSYLGTLDTLAVATDDATTRVDEHVVALNNAKDAALRVARAAEDQAEQQAKLSGQTLSAKDAALEQIKALELLAGSLAPGSELRNFLDATIRSLQATAMSGQEINNRLAAFARNGGKLAV